MALLPARGPLKLSGFPQLIGFSDVTLEDDGAVSGRLRLEAHHLNVGGIPHGGALVTILDSVMGIAVVRVLEDGEWTATQSLTTDFMRPARGTLLARGRVDRRGKLTAFVSGQIMDEAGDPVARASGTWAIRRG